MSYYLMRQMRQVQYTMNFYTFDTMARPIMCESVDAFDAQRVVLPIAHCDRSQKNVKTNFETLSH